MEIVLTLSMRINEKTFRIHNIMMNTDLDKSGERDFLNAYEPVITKKVLELLKPNDIVIDVGSWRGHWALLGAKKVVESNSRRTLLR